ncbi:hypothetical protein tb265_07340 [Gemmatimonadetes bacterium T265]|nr:hypothetical protein tb265_07340 [Gemmatimonadetes bacterium T265]
MSLPERLYTEAEYLILEDAASHKSEFVNGRIYAMSGASTTHVLITVNLTRELATQLRGRPCDTFSNDMRVKVGPTGAYFYPDATALCGERELGGTGAIQMLVNPSVVVEILSESTAAFDRGDKFEHYRRIPALQEYVLIAQDRMFVERHVRAGHFWVLAEFSRPDDLVELPSIACTLRVGDLYERVRFPADGARTAPRLVREEPPAAYAAVGG